MIRLFLQATKQNAVDFMYTLAHNLVEYDANIHAEFDIVAHANFCKLE